MFAIWRSTIIRQISLECIVNDALVYALTSHSEIVMRENLSLFFLTCPARKSMVFAMECRFHRVPRSFWRSHRRVPSLSTDPMMRFPSLRIPPRPCSKRRCEQRYNVKNHVIVVVVVAAAAPTTTTAITTTTDCRKKPMTLSTEKETRSFFIVLSTDVTCSTICKNCALKHVLVLMRLRSIIFNSF